MMLFGLPVQGGEEGNVELFNDSTAEFKPVVTLPDQKTVTGEEEESVAFTGAPRCRSMLCSVSRLQASCCSKACARRLLLPGSL